MAANDADLKAKKGDQLPSVPRLTASLNADYAFTQHSLQPTIGGNGTVRWRSRRQLRRQHGTAAISLAVLHRG